MYLRLLLAIGFFFSPLVLLAQPLEQAEKPADGPALEWLDFGDALRAAEKSGRLVIVDVYAPWCPWCARLQQEVYALDEVGLFLTENFETARLNIDDEEKSISFKGYDLSPSELAAGLGAEATPTIVFLTEAGDYITRVPGFVEAEEFMHILKYMSAGAYRMESYQDYRLKH